MDMVNKIPKQDWERIQKETKKTIEKLERQMLIYGSVPRMIILFCFRYNTELTKQEIHNLITEAGLDIKYKNTVVNIDKLEKAGFITIKEGGLYNAKVCSIAKKHKNNFDKLGLVGLLVKEKL